MSADQLDKQKAERIIRGTQDSLIREFMGLSTIQKFLKNDPRADFSLDGSIFLPKKYLFTLEGSLTLFLANDRLSMPPRHHIYRDCVNNEINIRQPQGDVLLRGQRFYGVDGKYEWGPNEKLALTMLIENLSADVGIFESAYNRDVNCKEDWLLKIALLEYFRNDVYTAYYFLKNKAIVEGDLQNEELKNCEELVTLVSTLYFDACININSNRDLNMIKSKCQRLISKLPEGEDFLLKYSEYDLLRAHREIGNPQSLMFAFNLIRSQKLNNVDVIVSPLFGGLDVVEALKYVDSQRSLLDGIGINIPEKSKVPNIIITSPKLMPRGASRSAQSVQAGAEVVKLSGEMSLLEKEQLSAEEKQLLADAQIICVADDTTGSGKASRTVFEWIEKITGRTGFKRVQADAHVNTRWKENHSLLVNPYSFLVGVLPIAIIPVSHYFVRPEYTGITSHMPDEFIHRRRFESDRILTTEHQLKELVREYVRLNIINAVIIDSEIADKVDSGLIPFFQNLGLKVRVVLEGDSSVVNTIAGELGVKPGQIMYIGSDPLTTYHACSKTRAIPAVLIMGEKYNDLKIRLENYREFMSQLKNEKN